MDLKLLRVSTETGDKIHKQINIRTGKNLRWRFIMNEVYCELVTTNV